MGGGHGAWGKGGSETGVCVCGGGAATIKMLGGRWVSHPVVGAGGRGALVSSSNV